MNDETPKKRKRQPYENENQRTVLSFTGTNILYFVS